MSPDSWAKPGVLIINDVLAMASARGFRAIFDVGFFIIRVTPGVLVGDSYKFQGAVVTALFSILQYRVDEECDAI
jgi:hypothetical protein